MQEISVLKVRDVLLVSIQTELNDRVAAALQESILQTIVETKASALVIDVSSLGLIDSYIGRVLTDTARMAHLMHTKVCLVGMRPAVAITLTEMGMTLPAINTAANLELGLESLGYRLEKRVKRAPKDETFAERSAVDARDARV